MILKVLGSALLLVALSLVQSTWLEPIAILGARPDLGLLAAVWIAYRSGPVIGSSASFLSGLVDDTLSAAPLGFNALMKTLVAWAASFLHGSIELDHFLMPILLGALATVAKALLGILLAILFRGGTGSYDFFGLLLWVEVGYNALLAPLLFLVLGLISRLADHGSARKD